MYDDLSPYEVTLANFGDRAAIIAGLEISDKITPEEAFQLIKELYKELKEVRKTEKSDWGLTK
jgi:hypothetical protein